MIEKNVKLWLGDGPLVTVRVSQFDTMWRFIFSIVNNSQPWEIPSGASAVLNGRKPDGNVFAFSGTIENNTVTVDADVQMTAVAGQTVCELSILSDGKVVGTANFVLDVEAAPKSPDDVSSDSTLPAYGELLGIVSGDIESAVNKWLNAHSSQIGGLSNEAKAALLALLEKVAYIDEDGQQYWDALHDALYPPANLVSISAVFNQGSAVIYDTDSLGTLKQYLTVTANMDDGTSQTVSNYTLSGTLTEGMSTITVSYGGKTDDFVVSVTEYPSYSITYDLTNFTSSNTASKVAMGGSYTTALSYDSTKYDFGSVTVTMGGTDITSTAYQDGSVIINEVTGNVVITAIARETIVNDFLEKKSGTSVTWYSTSDGTTQLAVNPYSRYIYVPHTASESCSVSVTITNNTENTVGAGEKIYAGETRVYTDNNRIYGYNAVAAYSVPSIGIGPGDSVSFTYQLQKGYRFLCTSLSENLTVTVKGIVHDEIVYSNTIPYALYNYADVTTWYSDDGQTSAGTKYYTKGIITNSAVEQDTIVTILVETGENPITIQTGGSGFVACTSSTSGRKLFYYTENTVPGVIEKGIYRKVYTVKSGYHLAFMASNPLPEGVKVTIVSGEV